MLKRYQPHITVYLGLYMIVILVSSLSLAVDGRPAAAQCTGKDPWGIECTANTASLKPGSASPQKDINTLIGAIIKTILGLTGVIFMIMIVAAGDLWMTAGGNEEKITKARTMIFNAAVGIMIVFGAYIVTDFLVGIVIEGIGG